MAKINKQGQIIGRKGLETRQRLLDAALSALQASRGDALTVAQVAQLAQTSPPTFYLYFNDVDDAICMLAEQTSDDLAELPTFVRKKWPAAKYRERARTLISTYFRIMRLNREVLQYRNAAADRGDARFIKARLQGAWPLIEALADKMLQVDPEASRTRVQALAQASVVVTAMERLAARSIPDIVEPGGNDDELIDAQAEIIVRLMEPRCPSSG